MKRKPMKRDDDEPQPAEQAEPEAPEPASPGALVEPPEEAVGRLEGQLAELKDRHLRLAAEYENFRKRTLKERTDLWGRAQAELVQRLVDALDDLARFAHVDPDATDARTIHDGIDMVERKVWKELEASGVTRVDQVGVPFDPNVHEAVTTEPTDHPAKDQTVGVVLQPGYELGGQLIRPARVAVLTWQGERAERGGAGGGDRPTPPGPQGEAC
ncbi:MAG: nucleotide exchange factor GrpE [Gemmatimonadales bacterium]